MMKRSWARISCALRHNEWPIMQLNRPKRQSGVGRVVRRISPETQIPSCFQEPVEAGAAAAYDANLRRDRSIGVMAFAFANGR